MYELKGWQPCAVQRTSSQSALHCQSVQEARLVLKHVKTHPRLPAQADSHHTAILALGLAVLGCAANQQPRALHWICFS